MVEVSRALMRGRSAEQQRDAVIRGFPQVPGWFRRAFPYSKWGAELNARITPAFFAWLVMLGAWRAAAGRRWQRCRAPAEPREPLALCRWGLRRWQQQRWTGSSK